MNKALSNHSIFFILAVLAAFIIYSCSDDTATNNNNNSGPAANTISGKVTFVQGTPYTGNGYYYVAAYSSWFPVGPPTAGDTVVPVLNNGKYEASYQLTGASDGQYAVTLAWIRLPYAQGSVYGLGIYGCDTPFTPSCVLSPSLVSITNNAGVENINFNCVTDTSAASRIYRF